MDKGNGPAPRVVSIDPPGAREIDDAIAARATRTGWRLDVCLPDVPAMLEAGGDADAEARERGVTTYSADAVRVSMLPKEVVARISLSPDIDAPMVHVAIDVTRDLAPTVVSVRRIRHRTAARLTYAEADRILGDPGHALHGDLAALWDLAARLHDERAAATGAVFDLERGLTTDEEGRTVRIDPRRAHRGNLVVMEAMILANSALAAHARREGVPVLYRNHRLQGMERGDRASAAAQVAVAEGVGPTVARRRLRTMSHLVGQADLGTASLGHHGLDQVDYAWFTSPLRRYVDVVNLRAVLEGARDAETEGLAAHLTAIHRRQKDESSDHHGRVARRKMVGMLDVGRHDLLWRTGLHVILRALDENPGFDPARAMQHIARRMAADEMSGREIAALADQAAGLFGDEAHATVTAWIGAEGPRATLLAEHRRGTPPPTRVAGAEVNHKGAIHELAAARRATVSFGAPVKTGTAHAPVFTVTATWNGDGARRDATGDGRSVRTAEQAAAAALLEALGAGDEESTPDRPAAAGVPTPTAGTAPKTALLEIAARTPGATVDFKPVVASGPPHAPRFASTVVATIGGETLRETAEGGTRREAERAASELMLAAIMTRATVPASD